MDFEPYRFANDQESGVRRHHRLLASYDGETHIYQFPDEDAERAVDMVKVHVEEGQLHPYAGLILVQMIRRSHGG